MNRTQLSNYCSEAETKQQMQVNELVVVKRLDLKHQTSAVQDQTSCCQRHKKRGFWGLHQPGASLSSKEIGLIRLI